MTERNFALDTLKFILACCVLILHFDWRIAPHAYLSVEFFFVISGFMLYKQKKLEHYSALNPIYKIYPAYIASIIIVLIFSNQIYDWWSIVLSVLMLQSIGLNDTVINVPSWFLCVYLIAIPLLAKFLTLLERAKIPVAFSCYIIALGSYIILHNNTPSTGYNYSFELKIFGITVGLWRCLAGVCVGIVAAAVETKIKEIKPFPATVVEISLLVYFVFLFSFSGWGPEYDFVSIPLIAIFIIALSRRKGIISLGLDYIGVRFKKLGTASTYVFLFHYPLIMVLNETRQDSYLKLIITFCFTVLVILCLHYSRKGFRTINKNI